MQALQVNADTGFLESQSAAGLRAFTSDKKVMLLDRARQIRDDSGKWPDLGMLCDSVGIDPRTLERHLKIDQKFAEQFRDVTLKAKWKLESGIYDLSGKNAMYALIWLRKHFPEEYHPEYKVSLTHDPKRTDELVRKAGEYTDAEIVE